MEHEMKWLLGLIGFNSPYTLLAAIVVAAGLFFWGRYEGGEQQRLEDAKAIGQAVEAARKYEHAAVDISDKIGLAAATKLEAINMFTIQQASEITRYVSPKASAACTINRGFVRLLHDAASGVSSLPDPTSGADDAASAVDLPGVGLSVNQNYGNCRAISQRLQSLQQWVIEQGKVRGD